MTELTLTPVQTAIAAALDRELVQFYPHHKYDLQPYPHTKRTYQAGNMTMPITWTLVEGIWLAAVLDQVLYDDSEYLVHTEYNG